MNHRQGGALKFPGEVLCTRSLEEAVLREEVMPESSRVSVVQQTAPSLLSKASEGVREGQSVRGHPFALQHKPGADFNVLILGLLCIENNAAI